MATYAKDLYRSSFTKGVRDINETSAVIIGLVTGLTDTRAGLKTASDTAATSRGPHHPDDSTLPLRSATAVAAGPTSAIVTLRYGRTSTDAVSGVSPFDAGDTIGGVTYLQRCFYAGSAGGNRVVGSASFNVYDVEVPCVTLITKTTRGASPLSAVANKIGSVNGDVVTWRGYSLPVNTVRFDGFNEKTIITNGTTEYRVQYKHTVLSEPWMDQFPATVGTTTVSRVRYGTAVFAGESAFPV